MAYVLDRDHMGGFHAGSNSHVIQTLQVGAGAFGAPAYWNGHLYYANRRDSLKDFLVENDRLVPTPVHRSPEQFAHPGAIPCVSANGIKNGIVWLVVSPGPNRQDFDSDAILHAYDAADVSHELYEAVLGPSVRFAMQTVAGAVCIWIAGLIRPQSSRIGILQMAGLDADALRCTAPCFLGYCRQSRN